jgi:hypothetical protein
MAAWGKAKTPGFKRYLYPSSNLCKAPGELSHSVLGTLNAIADPDHPDLRDAAEWFDEYHSADPVMSATNLTN